MQPLWITYSWDDNTEGNFDFLVQKLKAAQVDALYDRVALIPGQPIWSQLDKRISSDELSGWAYLLTPASLASKACQEELSYAIQRTIETKDTSFPLIGLLHNVSIRDVPVALRVRLCVNLSNPDWVEEIRAGLESRPPAKVIDSLNEIIVKTHDHYLGESSRKAIEIHPRFGELRYWRFAFDIDGPQPIGIGHGPANGGGISNMKSSYIRSEIKSPDGKTMMLYGAGDQISASTSAYAIFSDNLPTNS
jgi:hypothetical protein